MSGADHQAESKETRLLLAGLRRALDAQPHLLQGKEERGGLLPGGKAGSGPADFAIAEGLLLLTDPPAGVKAKRSERYVRLTDEGRRYLLEYDTPKNALRGLRPIVENTVKQIEQLRDEMQTYVSEQIGKVTDILANIQQFMEQALAHPQPEPEDEEDEPTPSSDEQPADPSEGNDLTPLRPGTMLADAGETTESSSDGEVQTEEVAEDASTTSQEDEDEREASA